LEQANQIKRIKRKIKANIPESAKVTHGRERYNFVLIIIRNCIIQK